jgi:DNA repair protein RadC
MRIGEIFKPALRYNASSIVVSHVHPSGEIEPSPEDLAMTQAMYTAGKLLDVPLLDHLIIGRDCWLSLKQHEQGFEETP